VFCSTHFSFSTAIMPTIDSDELGSTEVAKGKHVVPEGVVIEELDGSKNKQQRHFKGVTLHLLARTIAWLPAPAEIKLI
jgi:hypothetical protein